MRLARRRRRFLQGVRELGVPVAAWGVRGGLQPGGDVCGTITTRVVWGSH
jgi:hypothetical protein